MLWKLKYIDENKIFQSLRFKTEIYSNNGKKFQTQADQNRTNFDTTIYKFANCMKTAPMMKLIWIN